MPVAIALIIGVVVLATSLIGLIWALIVLLPFYAYVALALYLVWRSNRKNADLSASIQREADRQRHFNEQEMHAWRQSLEEDRDQTMSRRGKGLRRFDNTRHPGKK